MIKHLFLIIIACFIYHSSVYSSDFNFKNINSDAGLSQNNVKSIFQDSYGFLWFGTKNRLNRYDGIAIKVFDCYDKIQDKGNNNIGAIAESSDRKLWLGTDKGVYIYDPLHETFSFFDLKTAAGETISNWISDIQVDSQKNIWIVCPNQGVFKYEGQSGKLYRYTVVDNLLPSESNPQCMVISDDGQVWIGTNGCGIYSYDDKLNLFTQYLKNGDGLISLENKNIYDLAYFKGELIIGIHEEKLFKFNVSEKIFIEFPVADANYKIIRSLSILNEKELWVGTQQGIYIINLETYNVKHSEEDFVKESSLSDNIIETIFQDKEKNIWIGTGSGGVDNIPSTCYDFKTYFPSLKETSLKTKRIRRIIEDKNKKLWIGTDDSGVFFFDPHTSSFKKIPNLYYNKTLSLLENGDEVWVGYFKNGLDVINKHSSSKHYTAAYMGLNEESIYALCKDRNNNIWLGNAWGVYLAEEGSKKFTRQTQFGSSYTHDIIEDSDGNIWLATMGNGVLRYNPETKHVSHFVAGTKENTLSSNSVSSMTEDHLGQIWFSTDRGGICVYQKDKDEFKRYSVENGLPDDVAYKIVEDKERNLWFGTNKGLVKFNPKTEEITIFTKDNGLPSNQFNYNSGLITSSGELFFGTSNGLISFNPSQMSVNQYIPPIFINKISIFNEELTVSVSDSESLLPQSLIHTKKIILPYNRTNITIGFIALSYSSPNSNKYIYMMDNVDEGWIEASASQSASYSNLSPGKYRFKVKASNSDGLWNPDATYIDIVVTPPWWKTTTAYVIYIVCLFVIILTVIKLSTNRYTKRVKEKQKVYRIEKEKELYEDKVNFFTNIAHEIRTPLTLISAPLETLLENNINKDKSTEEYLNIIKSNTHNLLKLVNQLLDFRKVGNEKQKLKLEKFDLVALVEQSCYLFKLKIKDSDKQLKVHTQNNVLSLDIVADKDELFKLINNLISNSIKYSNKHIDIYLSADLEGGFIVHIKNDGDLIPEEYRTRVFDPFVQVKGERRDAEGSGIGLSLAKSLAEMHQGSLTYTIDEGLNNFILHIPSLQPENETEININEDSSVDNKPSEHTHEISKMTLLLVEDNTDILLFLRKKLEEKYNVFSAENGVKALEILYKEKVDVVISDIMMPQMDGFELCEKIKSDEKLSHIIVLLLTAKSDLESKIRGLELGADAYVEKPFSIRYLNTLLVSLVANRIRETSIFLKKPIAFSNQVNMNKADEEFIDRLNNIIQENIDNSDFNVISLAESMNVSRSGLHRKVSEILKTSPVEYIRLCKLQKAAELISEGKYRINEVAYMVGINTPSYFIKIFQAHYGMTPKEFEEHIRDNIK